MMSRVTETKRLLLIPSRDDLTDEVLSFYLRNREDIEATEPITHPDFYTKRYHKNLLRVENGLIRDGKMLRFWLARKEDPTHVIGTISFHNIRHASFQDADLGYKMDRAFRRMGYCKEAINAGLSVMASRYGLHRITAIVLLDNEPSIHLLRSLGFQREGLLNQNVQIQGKWRSHYLYSKLLF